MYYSLVHFPEIDRSSLNKFREKHDPYFGLIDSHITLVFPVKDSVGKDNLVRYVEDVLKNWKSFDIHMTGIEKAWDHWMFLLLKEGNEKIIKLHDDLYTGMLEPFLRKDIEFIPHIAIGLFAKQNGGYDLKDPTKTELNEQAYNNALKEAEELNFDYQSRVNKIALGEINDEFTKSTVISEFKLG